MSKASDGCQDDREHDHDDCSDELPPHYAALSIGVRATPEEVRSAYRRAALATHPDKGGDSTVFLLVVRAFEVLSDHIARQRYDLAWRAELYQELGGGKDDVAEQAASSSEVPGQKRKTCSSSEDKRNHSPGTHGEILESLFVLIKKAPRDERSALFKLLPRSLQSIFFKRFEKASSADEAQPGDSSLCVPVDSGSSSSEESEEETEGNPALALEDSSCADNGPTTSQPVRGRGQLGLRGISKKRGKDSLGYEATVGFSYFTIRSKMYASLEDAIECHIAFLSVKQAVLQESITSDFNFDDSIRKNIQAFCCQLKPTFLAYLSVRRFVGKGQLVTPATMDLDIALAARHELLDNVAGGWPSLREAWIRIQLQEGVNRLAARSRAELEALTQRWEENDSSRRAKAELRAVRRAARPAVREQAAAERCQRLRERRRIMVRNLIARYGSLDRKEALQRRKLNEARLQWHRRKDLTMADILRGPPM
ncbi:unnamed protein product [Polarella glacialis]|uniref:J domain-containing protein n=1 Tax=Polarella glacialis TaxID=89957 RepID=A0A813DQ19_POLGL|nr:unnamed protein product [Polarella glacialis]CAE8646620.1 unnamed protein product [Polarella glacialis]